MKCTFSSFPLKVLNTRDANIPSSVLFSSNWDPSYPIFVYSKFCPSILTKKNVKKNCFEPKKGPLDLYWSSFIFSINENLMQLGKKDVKAKSVMQKAVLRCTKYEINFRLDISKISQGTPIKCLLNAYQLTSRLPNVEI